MLLLKHNKYLHGLHGLPYFALVLIFSYSRGVVIENASNRVNYVIGTTEVI